jgi:deoxyribodipyrimidine photolyase-like uncharacterized protein
MLASHSKSIALFLSMRNFYTSFAIKGHQAVYFQINANSNPNDLAKSSTLVSKNTTLKI